MGKKSGKKPIDVEDIPKYFKDGWRTRIKKVGNYRYVTLKKGNSDTMIGPYKDELWEKIKEYSTNNTHIHQEKNEDVSEGQKFIDARTLWKKLRGNVDEYFILMKGIYCHFGRMKKVNSKWICYYWLWDTLPGPIEEFKKFCGTAFFSEYVSKKGVKYWAVTPGVICRECPAYLDERMIYFIKRYKLRKP